MKLAQSIWSGCLRGAPLLLIYLGLAIVNWIVKLRLTGFELWNSRLPANHELLLAFQYTNNEQSRIFQWGVPELLYRILPISVPEAYSLQRIGFVFLAFAVFHRYLRRWFSSGEAFSCVVLVAATIPLTYRPHLQESAPLLLLTFVAILWAIRERNHAAYAATMVVGAFANETALVLIAVHFFAGIDGRGFRSWLRPGLRSLAFSFPAFAVLGTLRYLTRDRPHLGDPYHLDTNLEGIYTALTGRLFDLPFRIHVDFILVFGVIWVLAFWGYKAKPQFMRRSLWVLPFFLAPHLITGNIHEARQMIPLGFVLIPAAAYYLFKIRPSRTLDSIEPGAT